MFASLLIKCLDKHLKEITIEVEEITSSVFEGRNFFEEALEWISKEILVFGKNYLSI